MYKGNQKIYAILFNKFSPEMCSKLEGRTGHSQAEQDKDSIVILDTIKSIMCGIEDSLQNKTATVMAKKILHMFWQNTNLANNDYKIQFDAHVNILEAYAVRMTIPPALLDSKLRDL